MLAHLTRKRLLRGDFRTGVLEYESRSLYWSGPNAEGDEFQSPICVVIDVGREFTMTFDGKLYLTGAGVGQYKTFTPWALYTAAAQGYYGFTLLWDEKYDHEEAEAVASS